MQNRWAATVPEAHLAERDIAAGTNQRHGMRALGNFRSLVEQPKGALGAGHRFFPRCEGFTESLDRLVKLSDVCHDQKQVAKRQRARFDIARADEQDSPGSHRDEQADQQRISVLLERRSQPGLRSAARLLLKTSVFMVLARKCLNHPNRPEHFLHDGLGRTFQSLHVAPLLAETVAKQARQHQKRRAHRHSHQRQPRAEPEGDVEHPA